MPDVLDGALGCCDAGGHHSALSALGDLGDRGYAFGSWFATTWSMSDDCCTPVDFRLIGVHYAARVVGWCPWLL